MCAKRDMNPTGLNVEISVRGIGKWQGEKRCVKAIPPGEQHITLADIKKENMCKRDMNLTGLNAEM